jgi:hypothetical protein
MKTTHERNSIRGFRQIYMCRSFKDIPKRCKVTFTLHIIILIVHVIENVLHGFMGVITLL